MTVIFAVLGQELLAAEQSVIATDGNGWQLHNLDPSLAQGASSPAQGPRFARLPPPPAQGPAPSAPNGRIEMRGPRLATGLAQQALGLLAESKFWTPECQRLSACRVGSDAFHVKGLWLCLAGAQSTEEAAAIAALLQYPGPGEARTTRSATTVAPVQPRTLRTLLPEARPATSGPLWPLHPHLQVFRSTNLLRTECSARDDLLRSRQQSWQPRCGL